MTFLMLDVQYNTGIFFITVVVKSIYLAFRLLATPSVWVMFAFRALPLPFLTVKMTSNVVNIDLADSRSKANTGRYRNWDWPGTKSAVEGSCQRWPNW
jgi:hypothetical protein